MVSSIAGMAPRGRGGEGSVGGGQRRMDGRTKIETERERDKRDGR